MPTTGASRSPGACMAVRISPRGVAITAHELVPMQQAVEVDLVDAARLCGAADVAAVGVHQALEEAALEGEDRLAPSVAVAEVRLRCALAARAQRVVGDRHGLLQDEAALDVVAQLADVARPHRARQTG